MSSFDKDNHDPLRRGRWYKPSPEIPQISLELRGHSLFGGISGGRMTRKFGSDGEHSDEENCEYESDEAC